MATRHGETTRTRAKDIKFPSRTTENDSPGIGGLDSRYNKLEGGREEGDDYETERYSCEASQQRQANHKKGDPSEFARGEKTHP